MFDKMLEFIFTILAYIILFVFAGGILCWAVFAVVLCLHVFLSLFGIDVLEKYVEMLNPCRGDKDDSYGG